VRDHIGNKLSLAFDDLGDQRVKNIAQAIRVYRVQTEVPAAQPASAALSLPDKPSIAVLPFQNMSSDPEQEYFADGMVEEIITALSRAGWFFVIARNSSFTYKGRAVDIRQVGRDLGVRYVLEGSVRKAGNRVRITGQLIDATDGRHVWADRFDGDLDDIFELQDRITHSVVAAITPSLRRAEFARAWAKPTSNLAAYDLYLRALERHYTQLRPATDVAIELLQRAIERTPDMPEPRPCSVRCTCGAPQLAGAIPRKPEPQSRWHVMWSHRVRTTQTRLAMQPILSRTSRMTTRGLSQSLRERSS
jgi:adenylate cyclase